MMGYAKRKRLQKSAKSIGVEKMGLFDKLFRKKIDGKSAEEWFKDGVTLYNLKKYEDAIQCFDRALEIVPNFMEALENKKIILSKLEEQKLKR